MINHFINIMSEKGHSRLQIGVEIDIKDEMHFEKIDDMYKFIVSRNLK